MEQSLVTDIVFQVLALSAENHGPAIGIARKLFDYYLSPPKPPLAAQTTTTTQPKTTMSVNNGTNQIVS